MQKDWKGYVHYVGWTIIANMVKVDVGAIL